MTTFGYGLLTLAAGGRDPSRLFQQGAWGVIVFVVALVIVWGHTLSTTTRAGRRRQKALHQLTMTLDGGDQRSIAIDDTELSPAEVARAASAHGYACVGTDRRGAATTYHFRRQRAFLAPSAAVSAGWWR